MSAAPSTHRLTTAARLIDVRVQADPGAGLAQLDGVTLTVTSGTLAVVGGDDPAAVRSLLLAIAGQVDVTGGTVEVAGHRLPADRRTSPEPWRRRVGVVPARPRLFDYLTPAENVALPVRWSGTRRPREHVAKLTRTLGLELRPDRLAVDLDVDERSRLALAMALAFDPDLIVVESGRGGRSGDGSRDGLARAIVDLVRLEGRTIVTDLADPDVVRAADQAVTLVAGRAQERRAS